ncbi:hypothetical protein C7B61_01260 [filamentous cyanobacterium CCP1]|nr:hypothetical protein C7B76_07740 [filamentous cyanobacterium CCP2]PSB68361.1 hypothetical protein C7B61_01260 [filamentous cyanobacterium CCP1]
MMNFKSIGLGAAALATAVSVGTMAPSAEAATIKRGDTLTFNGDVRVTQVGSDFAFDFAPFANVAGVGASSDTPPFVAPSTANIASFSAPVSVLGLPTAPLTPFLSNIQLTDGTLASFNLESLNFSSFISGSSRFFDFDLAGKFVTALGQEIPAFGGFTAQANHAVLLRGDAVGTTYSGDLRAVPTPALLPGLVGMGVAALRKKRKGEGFEATPETVKANA